MRNAQASDLVLRDPALASLTGALPGSDFGAESSFGSDEGGFGFGADAYGFGADGYGFGAGAPPPHPAAMAHPAAPPPPNQQALMNLWHHHHMQNAHTSHRKLILNPNMHSTEKIERYTFSLKTTLTLGTPGPINATKQPDTEIRGQRILMNAPCYGFAEISTLQMANVNVVVGDPEDAYNYSALAQGVHLDLPTLQPANRATVAGTYSGITPPPFSIGAPYSFITTLQGPATITA